MNNRVDRRFGFRCRRDAGGPGCYPTGQTRSALGGAIYAALTGRPTSKMP